jgi:hypothetical protein
MTTEAQNLPFACLPRLYFLLSAIVALHLSRVLYKFAPFYAKRTQFPKKSNVYNRSFDNELQRKMNNGHLVKTNPIKANFTCPFV